MNHEERNPHTGETAEEKESRIAQAFGILPYDAVVGSITIGERDESPRALRALLHRHSES